MLAAADHVDTTITDGDTATWSIINGTTSVAEGDTASYTVHLAGTLQDGETATIDLAISYPGTTSAADYASFDTRSGCGDRYSGPGTLSYSGRHADLHQRRRPMANLVISLGAVADNLVEGPENYTVTLSNAGHHHGRADLAGCGRSVDTTITDSDTATWSIIGTTSVAEGDTASYTVHLAGTLQAGETATIDLAITDISTTSADYASFSGGGDGSDRRPHV